MNFVLRLSYRNSRCQDFSKSFVGEVVNFRFKESAIVFKSPKSVDILSISAKIGLIPGFA